MYIMNVLDSRESSVQIHEKNKFCDENVQFLCSIVQKVELLARIFRETDLKFSKQNDIGQMYT